MLLLLHAHIVAAAEAMQSINPKSAVMELAASIVTNYVPHKFFSCHKFQKCINFPVGGSWTPEN